MTGAASMRAKIAQRQLDRQMAAPEPADEQLRTALSNCHLTLQHTLVRVAAFLCFAWCLHSFMDNKALIYLMELMLCAVVWLYMQNVHDSRVRAEFCAPVVIADAFCEIAEIPQRSLLCGIVSRYFYLRDKSLITVADFADAFPSLAWALCKLGPLLPLCVFHALLIIARFVVRPPQATPPPTDSCAT
jgi:hypothetical protein